MNHKLPLRYGLLGLAGVWAAHSYVDDPRTELVLLVVGMGIALWTAFSLHIPPRKPPESDAHLQIHDGADETPRLGPLGDTLGPRIVADTPEDSTRHGEAHEEPHPDDWEEEKPADPSKPGNS